MLLRSAISPSHNATNALAERAGDLVCASRTAPAAERRCPREPPQIRDTLVDGARDKTRLAVGDDFRLRQIVEHHRNKAQRHCLDERILGGAIMVGPQRTKENIGLGKRRRRIERVALERDPLWMAHGGGAA